MQPVSVCLHYHDINKGLHKIFLDHNIEVLTVGHPFHPDFIDRFYNLLRNYKYVTSNEFGSYTYYAVEMEIPFFLYGNPAQFINKGDENYEKGIYDSYKNSKQMKKALELFADTTLVVTPEQRKFVELELGIDTSISRIEAGLILYGLYLKYLRGRVKLKVKSILGEILNLK